ncbi:MAG: 3-deoxy-7-phosphoheptulonate synthase [Deferribacteraceae bacterium]|jgi:3-deoxy-7-phosphoheptulonate synthase|nr:3-deoxy-7-phosphoheptulonate synthase [Deferribacteraceae bacterium]
MIITLKKEMSKAEMDTMIHELESVNSVAVTVIPGETFNVLGLVGDTTKIDEKHLRANKFVENVTRIAAPYKKANRMFHPEDTVVSIAGGRVKIGGHEKIAIMGGPCSVESHEQMMIIGEAVRNAGASMLRGGAYKPRTSPYAFQGMATEGIKCMTDARECFGLPIVSELMSADKIDEFVENVDLIQVGARNMQNFELLKALGRIKTPILLKRGLANTIEEWIMAAEYIMAGGNSNVIFCERGIRTFEKYTRNTLDLSVIPIIKQKTHLPIVIDPSHGTGYWEYVESMSLAAIAAGADGLIIEVHHDPERAASDGTQSLKPKRFAEVIERGRQIAQVIGRDI